MYFFICVLFGYFCQWLLIFACQPFLFRLNYLDHTHFLTATFESWHWTQWQNLIRKKLHLTCANDHDGVRVCHWTIANHSCLLQMHWLFSYCVNDTLLGHAMSCLKISLCPGLELMQTNESQQSSREACHLEKQLKQQLDNKLLIEWFLQRIDSQIDEIAFLCKINSKWTYSNVHN